MNSKLKFWLQFLPAPLLTRIENSPNLQKVLFNTGWLFADNIIRLAVGLFVSVWVARYLGPEQFGLFSYAMAFVALFGAIASMGLNGIVVRDLVIEPKTANTTLGTALALQLIGGLLAFCLAVVVIGYARPNDSLARLMVAVLGFVMVLKASEVVKYWFESQVQSKYTVWVENTAFLVFVSVKVVLILNQSPLMAFVWSVLAEAALVAVALLAMYTWRGSHIRGWQIKSQRAKTILKDSWPLILSGLAVMVYMRIDQIMLGQMLGDEAVGVYSAAVRISEVWFFIPMAIVASVFPALMKIKDKNEFNKKLQKLFDVMAIISIPLAITISIFSTEITDLLFGLEYSAVSAVLKIQAWLIVFAFIGVPAGRLYLYADLQVLALYRNLFGASLNIVSNYYTIPISGVIGAAYSTLIAYFTANIIFNYLNNKTRFIFIMQIRSLLFMWLVRKK